MAGQCMPLFGVKYTVPSDQSALEELKAQALKMYRTTVHCGALERFNVREELANQHRLLQAAVDGSSYIRGLSGSERNMVHNDLACRVKEGISFEEALNRPKLAFLGMGLMGGLILGMGSILILLLKHKRLGNFVRLGVLPGALVHGAILLSGMMGVPLLGGLGLTAWAERGIRKEAARGVMLCKP